jgi:DNA repair exonuclease SbcCD ATPase subunit
MKINYIEIQGFRSIQKLQRFEFDVLSNGFYFISGENQVDPELGSNGSGKSTFFSDAVMWVFEGKTSLGLKAGNIKSWDTKEKCVGKIGFMVDGSRFEVFRSWSPNTLTLTDVSGDTKEITQEELDDLIGFNYTSLLHSVIISQFSTKFFDLDPAPKLEVFSEILGGVDVWLEKSERAKLRATKTTKALSEATANVNTLTGSLQTLRAQDYSEKLRTWKGAHDTEIDIIKQDIEEIKHDQAVINKDLKTLVDEKANYLEMEAETGHSLAVTQLALDLLDDLCKIREKKISEYRILINLKREELLKFEVVGGVCSHCAQIVSPEHIEKEMSELNVTIDTIEDCIAREDLQLKGFDSSWKKTNSIKGEHDLEYEKLQRKVSDCDDLTEKLEDKYQVLGTRSAEKMVSLEAKDNETNPYAELQKQNEESIASTLKDLDDNNTQITYLNVDLNVYEYWVKAFKEIRLLVIDEALAEFEIYLNNSLQSMGLGSWNIEASIDKETASRTIKKGFYVLVSAPNQKKAVPFESYCGGERGILRFAATVGLIEFIKSRKNVSCDVEIWDEPTINLSPQATDNLLSLLRQRSETRKVLLIDHHKLESSGHFTGKIHVTRDLNGSRVDVLQ